MTPDALSPRARARKWSAPRGFPGNAPRQPINVKCAAQFRAGAAPSRLRARGAWGPQTERQANKTPPKRGFLRGKSKGARALFAHPRVKMHKIEKLWHNREAQAAARRVWRAATLLFAQRRRRERLDTDTATTSALTRSHPTAFHSATLPARAAAVRSVAMGSLYRAVAAVLK